MFCRKCGAENKEESQYCSKCGALLRPVSGEKKMQTPKKGKKGALGIVLIVLAVVLIAGIFITVNKVKEKQYKSNVTSADRYLKDMDYEKAEDHYLKAIAIDGKQEIPYLKLADIYEKQSEPEKAKEILELGAEKTGSDEIRKRYSLYTYVSDILIPEIGECGLGPFECGYESRGKFDIQWKGVHSESGVITSNIADFDHDGKQELLVAVMDNMGTKDHVQGNINTVYLYMYENEDGNIKKQCEYKALEEVLGVYDQEDDWVFLKETQDQLYICGSKRERAGLFVNGEALSLFVVTYDGTAFLEYMRKDQLGSDFHAYMEEEKAENLEKIGLEKSAEEIRKNGRQYFPADEANDGVCFHIYGKNEYLNEEDTYSKEQLKKFYENYDVSYIGNMIVQIKIGERGEPVFESDMMKQEESDSGQQEIEEDTSEDTSQNQETTDYKGLYGPILSEAYNNAGEYASYYVYDIDKDGTTELMVWEGTGEADAQFHIYSIKDGNVVDLGSISAWHAALYADEGNGTEPYIIEVQQYMDGETMSHVSIEDGKAVLTQLYSEEVGAENYYTNPYPIPYAYVTDLSLLEDIK